MKKNSIKLCFLFFLLLVGAHLFYVNRPIKQKDIVGFYYGFFPYGIHDRSSFMLILDRDGTYFYSYMHNEGTRIQCNGKWEFYVDDRKSARITFEDFRDVDSDNAVSGEHFSDTFLKRNMWGKIIIPIDYDAGMILVKQ